MKKYFYSMLMLAMSAFAFTACEDVPEPYEIPGGNGNQGGTELPEGTYMSEAFTKDFGTFTVQTINGTPWVLDSYGYAKGTGYADGSTTASKSYLVSQPIDLSTSKEAKVVFDYVLRYADRTGIENKVLITDNYSGDPETTTWTDITGTLTNVNDWSDWQEFAANVPAAMVGKNAVVLAFLYSCGSSSATWEVKNVAIKEGKVEENETPNPPTPPAAGTYIDETFSSSFGSFTVKTIKGADWIIDFQTAKASGYDNASKVTTASESYLVSSAIDLSAAKEVAISFEYILRYVTNNGAAVTGVSNKVLITKDYTGDPTTTQWTDITGTLTEGKDWSTFAKYSVAVPADFLGQSKVVIAFYYACGESSGTWEVKNLTVKDGKAEGGNTGGGNTGDGGTTVDGAVEASSWGLENAAVLTTLNMPDGTTLTFDAGSNQNGPKYYTTGKAFRMYPNNSMKVDAAKTIKSITFVCDIYNGTTYNASGDITAAPGTVSVSNEVVTISDINSKSVTITNASTTTGAPSQIRMKSIAITYAE